ncbi:SH3 domain-containing protein [Shimia gijangensis]|uniref:SH3 domain-containing protein n=1 Tax=Shimia gijangensis TaxID=1470563 RepID=A0A1M6HVM1_9RHOB|nr:SH3 domain-containing protein [Shimia gijangensis]SHJ26292.1 SH3 domain-containing protein [Shimia gijangensis]
MRYLLKLILTLCFVAPGAWAADLSVSGSDICQTRLSGQITKGDAETLRAWYIDKGLFEGNIHNEALCLDGPGGSLGEALKMSRFLYEFGIRTRLDKNATCLSACAVLFMMGTEYADHGSGDGLNADRRMHVTAQLGFHRPELRLPSGGSVDTEQLGRAYDLAIDTVLEFVRLANFASHSETMIASDLIEVMMERKGENFFYIDTVGKAGRWNIGLEGLTLPRAMDKQAALTACNNLAIWQLRYIDDYNDYSYDDQPDYDEQVEVLTSSKKSFVVFGDFGAMDHHHECIIRLSNFGDGFYELSACGFMDAEGVTIGERRCEDAGVADPMLETWSTDLVPLPDGSRLALLPPGTRLIQADSVARNLELRAVNAEKARDEGLLSFRTRCSGLVMSAQIRGVTSFTNLRSSPGFDGEVVAQIALGERVTPISSEEESFIMAEGASEACRSSCEWMGPGPGGLKALYGTASGLGDINQCFEDNLIWYHVETQSGQQGYLSGKFLRY